MRQSANLLHGVELGLTKASADACKRPDDAQKWKVEEQENRCDGGEEHDEVRS
jgi:hypothetical protein